MMQIDERTKHLALLMECFSESTITDSAMAVYLDICNSVSLEAVERGCHEFCRGFVKRYSCSKIPSAAEFGIHLRKINAERQSIENKQALEAKQRAEMKALQQAQKRTPEQQAKRDRRVEEVRLLTASWRNPAAAHIANAGDGQ